MKSLLLFCAGLAAGTTLGWLAWSSSSTDVSPTAVARPGSAPRVENSATGERTDAGTPAKPGREAVAGHVKLALEASALANDKLDDTAFGEKLAELITKQNRTLEDRVEAEGMKTRLNPERFLEFYQAYTRRRTLSDGDNDLNPILTEMGKKYGRQMIDTMASKYPGGFVRMDSLIHGWAMSKSEDAVAWFNGLPDDYSRYDSALQGLVWGLTEKDGAMAGKVIAELSPADRRKSIYGFTSSFIHSHGLQAFDAWTREAPAELASRAIERAPEFVGYLPPAEYVPWFVSHSPTLGIRQELRNGLDQWLAAAPVEAMNWLAALPPEQRAVQSSLGKHINGAAAQKFLSENPSHPAAALLKTSQSQ